MKLITIKELSEYLKVKQVTLYSWACSGRIPSYKLNGVLRFDRDEIEEWVKSSKVEPFNFKQELKISRKGNKDLDIDGIVKRAVNEVKRKTKLK